jgi:hypothetical protein
LTVQSHVCSGTTLVRPRLPTRTVSTPWGQVHVVAGAPLLGCSGAAASLLYGGRLGAVPLGGPETPDAWEDIDTPEQPDDTEVGGPETVGATAAHQDQRIGWLHSAEEVPG